MAAGAASVVLLDLAAPSDDVLESLGAAHLVGGDISKRWGRGVFPLWLAAARMSGNDVVDRDRGAIVLTASLAAFDGQIGQTSYTASKAGVHGITLVATRDLASWAIRVNTIAPGVFDTPMLARLREDIREGLAASVPHPKRLGDADDYAHLAIALLENPYVNGHTVRLDGAIRMAPAESGWEAVAMIESREPEEGRGRFRELPEPVRPEQWVETLDATTYPVETEEDARARDRRLSGGP